MNARGRTCGPRLGLVGRGASLLAVLALIVGHALWLPWLGRFLVVDERPGRAEAVVPLAGEPQRAAHAAELVRDGHAPLLIVTPLPLPPGAGSYARGVEAIARRTGVPQDAIRHVPTAARSTHGEAVNLRAFVGREGIASLLVTTSPWHTRRSSIIFANVFRGSDVAVRVVAVPERIYARFGSGYRPGVWWTSPSSRKVTLSEYLKLVAYALGVR